MKQSEKIEQFLERRAYGKSFLTIEREMGIDRRTLARWDSNYKEEIEKLKAMELEALRERYWLTEQARIERFGSQLTRVMDELEKRDLSDIGTPKLVDLALKLDAALGEGDRRTARKTPDKLNDASQGTSRDRANI